MIGDTNYGRAKERGGTASAMASDNPVLAAREIAASVDGTTVVVKIGDGVTPWNDLPALGGGGGGGGAYIEADGPTERSGATRSRRSRP
jgi:hypothetical protein